MDGASIENDVLFESALAKQGLSIEDAIICAQNSKCFTLAIPNYNFTPIDLTGDQIIGSLVEEATIVESTNIESHINAIRVDCSQEYANEIRRVLAVEESKLKRMKRRDSPTCLKIMKIYLHYTPRNLDSQMWYSTLLTPEIVHHLDSPPDESHFHYVPR